METTARVNINSLIDNSRLGAYQWGIFILCALCLIMDGFDLQAIGYVAPALVRDWKIPSASLGPVFSAALVGVLVGSLLFSMLADKIGRRPVLIAVSVYFSALTFFTARTNSVNELIAARFLAGIGLGGIMPNALALVGEYSPARLRVTVMMVVSNGFTAGAAIGGFVAAALIPAYGWRGVFYFGAAVPLAIAALMFFVLPESLQFMALRGSSPRKIALALRNIDPGAPSGEGVAYVVNEEKKRGVPITHLFEEGRALGTVLLWVINFMNLLNLYFLSNWLPTVVRDLGYSNSNAVLAGAMVQVGGTIGAFALGWFVYELGFVPVLTSCFLLGALSIAAIGQPSLGIVLLFIVVFVAGWCVPGAQAGINALAAVYYPTDLRATGIGSGLGIGRIGAIVGPLVAGELLRRKWASRELFYAAAIPALISAIAMFSMRRVLKTPLSPLAPQAERLLHGPIRETE
ncbi:MAG: MFS transporter [Bryobacteraceae bacterium]|jgi:AAHS family 4-hydroxybenzoate transporter-like MFS transporter